MEGSDKTDEIIRRNLIRFRGEAGLTLEEASQAAGISLDYLAKIEKGKRSVPGAAILKRLGEAYGHVVDHFFLEEPPPPDRALMPAFAMKVLAKDADPKLVDKVSQFLAEVNREHLEQLRAKKRKTKT
jgi:transcriptional regulator with XRE-family HTH domain